MTDKDLLGDAIAPTPAMTDPLPWRIFQVSDCEWWVARSIEEAKVDAAAAWGWPSVEECERDGQLDEVVEISEEGMDRLKFVDEEAAERVVRTFREQLALEIAAGLDKPGLFAGTESCAGRPGGSGAG